MWAGWEQVRSTAGTLQTLQGQVSSEVEGVSKLRVSQLDAREKLLADTEARLRESQRRSEDECIRLQAMLQALEGTVKEQREQVGTEGVVLSQPSTECIDLEWGLGFVRLPARVCCYWSVSVTQTEFG